MHLSDVPADHPVPRLATIALGKVVRDDEIADAPLDEKRVEKLRRKFKPHLIGAPVVSRRPDGSAEVLNGSHRTAMLRRLYGDGLEIDVLAFDGLSAEQERGLYQHYHRKRKKQKR